MPRKFRDLFVYKLGHQFVLDIYPILESFPEKENNNLASQMRRAATSLPLNVAEGASDRSDKVFVTYLCFAYRSAKELEACFELALDLGYINKNIYSKFLHDLETIAVKFYRLMSAVENKPGFRRKSATNFYGFEKFKLDSEFSSK